MSVSENVSATSRQLMTELQSAGLRLADPRAGAASRRGGAGPSDHKAVTVDGVTIMVPVHTSSAWNSPFVASEPDATGTSALLRGTIPIATISFPKQPRFYAMQTLDGVPYSHIATLHSADVLATTVLQTCIRYESRRKSCKFCAIGQSLAAGRTIARKTPEQLAEVARAAVLLDGVADLCTLGGDDESLRVGMQRLGDQSLGHLRPVRIGGVHEIHRDQHGNDGRQSVIGGELAADEIGRAADDRADREVDAARQHDQERGLHSGNEHGLRHSFQEGGNAE